MPFRPVVTEKLSGAVVKQVENLILQGILKPGERLPSERELADQLGVSRPSVREAIAELQDKGLLTSRAGSGVYVSEVLGHGFSDALVHLIAGHEKAQTDYISFRRDIEALAASRAAQEASDTDLAVIDTIFGKMREAHDARDADTEAHLDVAFHMAIMEASHNVIMLHMMRSMFELLQQGVFYNRKIMFLQHTTRETLLAQHEAINKALQRRDATAVYAAVTAHLDFVETRLQAFHAAQRNEETARLRLTRAQKKTPSR